MFVRERSDRKEPGARALAGTRWDNSKDNPSTGTGGVCRKQYWDRCANEGRHLRLACAAGVANGGPPLAPLLLVTIADQGAGTGLCCWGSI